MDALIVASIAGCAGAALSALACGWHCGGKIQRRDTRIVQLQDLIGRLESDIVHQAGAVIGRDGEIERLTRNARATSRALSQAIAERDAALLRADAAGSGIDAGCAPIAPRRRKPASAA